MASTSKNVSKVRINMYMPKELVDRIDAEAIRLGMSRSNVLCVACDRYFEAKMQEQIVSSGIDSLSNRNIDMGDLLEFMLGKTK